MEGGRPSRLAGRFCAARGPGGRVCGAWSVKPIPVSALDLERGGVMARDGARAVLKWSIAWGLRAVIAGHGSHRGGALRVWGSRGAVWLGPTGWPLDNWKGDDRRERDVDDV